MSDERCRTCRFWMEWSAISGSCRRVAPAPVVKRSRYESQDGDLVWPRTDAEDWCGEWQERAS